MPKNSKSLISKIYQDPQYAGKHIIIIGGEIHAKKTGAGKSNLLEKLIKKYPEEKPIIAYVPKEDTLILLM